MSRILAPAEAAVLRACAEACEKAAASAAKEIGKDFKKKVFDQSVEDYYSEYTPGRYGRSGGLKKAFKVKSIASGKIITLTGDWNFNRLPRYKSNSKYHKSGGAWISRYDDNFNWDSGSNGVPEKGWIFTNFMEGIHPIFYLMDGLVFDDSVEGTPSYMQIKKHATEYVNNGNAKDILVKHLKRCARALM